MNNKLMNKKSFKNLTGRSLVGDSVNRDRVKDDYYATPPKATQVLLDNLDLSKCKTFLEPSCGEGHISKVLESNFKESKVFSTDLVNRGYGKTGINFLNIFTEKVDCVITNPPFKLAKEFIQKGLSLSNKYVIMFAKIQLLEGIGRKELFEKYPPKYIYVFSNRVNPLRNGLATDEKGKPWASTMCFAWFVWEVGFNEEPIVRWLDSRNAKLKSEGYQRLEIWKK